MSDIFGFRAAQPTRWYHKRRDRSNYWCLYCGEFVGKDSDKPSNKEHLIGRNFVPTGTLDRDAFNFIFRACSECNGGQKSAAEGHISSVTLFSSPARASNADIDSLAAHKASRAGHPEGGLVQGACARQKIEFSWAGVGTAGIGLVGPPPLDSEYVRLLATRQVQALFSLVTSKDPRTIDGTGFLAPGYISLYGWYPHTDWGNPQVLEIAKRTIGWDCPAKVVTARGFFRALLKRSRNDSDGWFWALEWNKAVRVLGAICKPASTPEWLQDLPDLDWKPYPGGRWRQEVPLSAEQDFLFGPCR